MVRFCPDHFSGDLIKFIIDVIKNGVCTVKKIVIYFNRYLSCIRVVSLSEVQGMLLK